MTAIGERVHYLSLAMDARRALNAIHAASQGNVHSGELQDAIRVAAKSLMALSTAAEIYSKHSPDFYVEYEAIQILREVISSMDTRSLIDSLQSLLSAGAVSPTSEDLSSARKFFRALETRAMHHYNDPDFGDAVLA